MPKRAKPQEDTAGSEAAKRRRQLERRDTAMQVDREIATRFPHMSASDIDVRRNSSGLTLREEITKDKREAKASGRKLSSAYWSRLGAEWAPEAAPGRLLEVKDQSQPVDPRLLEALKTARSSNTTQRSRAPLIAWLGSATAPNQKAVGAVLRQSLSCNPALSSGHLQMVLATMRWLCRVNTNGQFNVEVAICRSHFDKALCAQVAGLRRQGVSDEEFWSMSRDIVGLVHPPEEFAAVFQGLGGPMENIGAQLTRICSSCEFGQKLFSVHMVSLAQARLQTKIDCTLQAVPIGSMLNQEKWAKLTAECQGHAEQLCASDYLKGARRIVVLYRGVECTVQVCTVEEEVFVRCMAWLKTLVVQGGLLEGMWFEPLILGRPSKPIMTVSPHLFSAPKLARALLAREVERAQPTTGDMSVAMMRQKAPLFSQADSTFVVELGLCEALAAGPGARRLHEEVMRTFPAEGRLPSLEITRGKLENTLKSQLFAFVSSPTQSAARTILTAISDMERGYAPRLTNWEDDPMLAEAKVRMAGFVHFQTPPAEAGHPGELLTGDKALLQKLDMVKKKRDRKEHIAADEVKDFNVFVWLLSGARQDEARALANAVYQDLMASGATLVTKVAASSGDGKKRHKCAKATATTADDEVMALFS